MKFKMEIIIVNSRHQNYGKKSYEYKNQKLEGCEYYNILHPPQLLSLEQIQQKA